MDTWKQERQLSLSVSPQINLARSTSSRMRAVGLCAGAAVIQSSLTDGYASLVVAVAALLGALSTELLLNFKNGGFSKLLDGSAAASALVLTILLPNKINPFMAFLGAAFAMGIIKYGFGGLGSNWLNPALGGWLFIRFSWYSSFEKALEGSNLSLLKQSLANGLSSLQGSPLSILSISGLNAVSALDQNVRTFLNGTVFSFAGAELPAGYVDLFVPPSPGIIADRGLLALILGSIVLLAFQVGRFWVPLVYLLVYAFFVRALGAIPLGGPAWQGDILFGLLSGGTVAAAFFLAMEPAASAKSRWGILFSVFLSAFLAWYFRYQNMEMYGAFFAAAFVNALGPFLRTLEQRFFFRREGAAK